MTVLENGEHVLGAAGEVHLETCIKDLKERFARIDLQVSPPLVAFRESIYMAEDDDSETPPSRPARWVVGATPNGRCVLRVRAHGLPGKLATVLSEDADALRGMLRGDASERAAASGADGEAAVGATTAPGDKLRERLASVLAESVDEVKDLLGRCWAMGPKGVGPNMLLAASSSSSMGARGGKGSHEAVVLGSGSDRITTAPTKPSEKSVTLSEAVSQAGLQVLLATTGAQDISAFRVVPIRFGKPEAAAKLGWAAEDGTAEAQAIARLSVAAAGDDAESSITDLSDGTGAAGYDARSAQVIRQAVESGLLAGFQLATAAGPLCDEPMWGVAFEVSAEVRENEGATSATWLDDPTFGPFSGQVIALSRELFRRALVEANPRLVEAMFFCEVTTAAEALAGTYAALNRRRARILREDMREGSDLFTVHCYLPVEASFGFANEMRHKTGGAAQAQLMLSHWERLSSFDPFFVPRTEEEREEFGEEGQGQGGANTARKLIDAVRRRKGLPVEEKIVQSATKQRTLARKV